MNSKKYILSAIVASALVGCGGGSSDSATPSQTDGSTETNSTIVVASAQKNADFSDIGLTKANTTPTKSLSYEDSLERYVVQNSTPDGNDNYIRSFATHGSKIAVASVYHNALTIFDTSNNSYKFSPFAAYVTAGDDKDINGKELTNEGEIDGVTQASENWLNEVKFSSNGEYVYLNVRPKYLGRTKSRQVVPDPATYGLYKAKVLDDNTVSKDSNSTIRFKGQFYFFDFLNDGSVMTMDANGTFYKLDENLSQISNFKVENVKRFDVKNDKLYLLIENGESKYIQQYNIDSGEAIGNQIAYNKEVDSKGYSMFELTQDATKIVTYAPSSSDAEVCTITLATQNLQCTNIGIPLSSSIGGISPDGKYAAFTPSKDYTIGGIVNVENKPALVGQYATSGKRGYAMHFTSNTEFIYATKDRNISTYSITDGQSITNNTKLEFATNSIFSQNAEDMNSIEVEAETEDNVTTYEGDINFISFLNGVNISYTLSSDFKDYIDTNGKFLKMPDKAVTGTITANFTLLQNGEDVGKTTKSTSMTIKPKS